MKPKYWVRIKPNGHLYSKRPIAHNVFAKDLDEKPLYKCTKWTDGKMVLLAPGIIYDLDIYIRIINGEDAEKIKAIDDEIKQLFEKRSMLVKNAKRRKAKKEDFQKGCRVKQ